MRSLLLLAIIIALTSCNIDLCESDALTWKNNAYATLNEFKAVDEEIKNHYDIFKKEEFARDRLFLRTDDSIKFEKKYGIKLPKLREWFKTKDWGYIAYDTGKTSIAYKECSSGRISYQARLYRSPNGLQSFLNQNLVAKVKDTLSLGNNWYYILTKCIGCGE